MKEGLLTLLFLLSGILTGAIPVVIFLVTLFMKADTDGEFKLTWRTVRPLLIAWVISLIILLTTLYRYH